jgi:peroxiredoxin Q/BCP
MLQAGALAPDFTLPADDGSTVRLSELRGRPVVLYFYPKDASAG